ncbi:uncharacterized protein LOC111305611 isoform X2 [Durio zibethinus]|uniref:Uncharacterized protein LOC111305611 isoform X2 n=1 Tax=Durio zibethinus TaxID=66656 RepID=A0A6P6A2T5_DURZI|nr:uncharacterized protein LOC111305611 isoform X2 [Durio zibethinus]
MSFLAGRLAGKEAAFFFQESKHAVNRLAEKTPKNLPSNPPSVEQEAQADVLPEVLKHSLPSKIFRQPFGPSSLSRSSKWALHSDPNNASISSPDALNPLRAYLSLPQVSFGPKRWQLPSTEHSVMASTANELRKDKYTPLNPEKLKAAAEGLQQIGKAFVAATAIVFGGAALMFGMAASKLELHNSDDVRTKGKDLVQPKFEMIREQLFPLRTWAENMSKKWHLEREEAIKEKPIIKELSKILGVKSSN